jgi:periplasmic divalent cation tolerance protein
MEPAGAFREPGALVIFCACPDVETAIRLGRALVERGHVGCAQVLTAPIRSIYRWQGVLHDEVESLLLLKAPSEAWEVVRDTLAELHPYDVPEILACPAAAHPAYLAWLREADGR